jgi:hypothetical protein
MKLRLGHLLAVTALLVGCPERDPDAATGHGAEGEATLVAEPSAEKEYVCINQRPWREDLDLPESLKNAVTDIADPNADATRERRKKDYVATHEGTYTICRTILEKSGDNRGTCPICTAMLKSPEWKQKRINNNKGDQIWGAPIELLPGQEFTDKVEFRLEYRKEDYIDPPTTENKIANYREYLRTRKIGPIITGYDTSKQPPSEIVETDQQKIIDLYVQRAQAKGVFAALTPEGKNKEQVKFGLPPLAELLVKCPTCKKPIDQTESRCWNCGNGYILSERDEKNAIPEPLELLCPFCKQPVDPTLNYCANPKCEKFHRTIDREGTCWMCGGSGVCPNCLGSAKGSGPINGLPDDCFLCGGLTAGKPGEAAGTRGLCPECGGKGFIAYEGGLMPNAGKLNQEGKRLAGDWKLHGGTPARAGGGGDKPADKPADKGGDKGGEDK